MEIHALFTFFPILLVKDFTHTYISVIAQIPGKAKDEMNKLHRKFQLITPRKSTLNKTFKPKDLFLCSGGCDHDTWAGYVSISPGV